MKKKKVQIIDYGEFQNEYYPELVCRTGVIIDEVVRYQIKFEDGDVRWVYARHTKEVEE